MKPSLHQRDIVRARLARQFLATPGPKKASDVVREVAGDSILRTHVLRPTWHLVAPADIRWMLALTAPRVKAAMAYYDRKLELTPAIFHCSNAALTEALRGGKHLMRPELGKALERAGVKNTSGQRLGHLMLRAELDAVVCSGPRRGKQFTYALLEERVPLAPALERDAALLELTRRYFTTRGPATARDFAWWSGLAISDVKRGLAIAERELEQATLDGQDVWFADRKVPKAKPSAHLLPNYDEYFIGYKNRSAIAQRLGQASLVEGGNALIANVVFVDGQLVGGWKRMFDKKTVVVALDLLARLTAAERKRVLAAARRFGEFVGSAVKLRG